jgi:hypothetical protein
MVYERSMVGGVCHWRIAEVAKAAAKDLYEVVMGNNEVRRKWKEQNFGADEEELIERFVTMNWGKCIDYAKQTMVLLLRRDDVSEEMKDEIMDALIKDNDISKTRRMYRGGMH